MTHWHQADTVASACPPGASVLEVGPGNGHTTWLMRNSGLSVTTLDYDARLRPHVQGDATALPFADAAFDCVLAAEVLEHLPFTDVPNALASIRRVTMQSAVITLPAPMIGAATLLNVPRRGPFRGAIGLPLWTPHRWDGQHHWELGRFGYSHWRVRRLFRNAGFRIVRHFRPSASLYAYFFVLERTH